MKHNSGLWHHESRSTIFTLAVEDFGIIYSKKSDADHLYDALSKKYSLTIDWTGTSYLGLTMNWHYDDSFVDISVPEYVPKALSKFHHISTKRTQHARHPWTSPV